MIRTCQTGRAMAFAVAAMLAAVCGMSASAAGTQALELSNIFQRYMVLQRDRSVCVWGKAPTGSTVTVSFAGQTATSATVGSDLLWEVTFKRPFAANPTGQTLKATCSNGTSVSISDVLVGDVWIAAGQSNMVLPVTGSNYGYGDTYGGSEAVTDMSNHPQIRWMALDADYSQATSPEPYAVVGTAWSKPSASLSAVAYYFAHDLVTAHPDVPVGIIGSYCNALGLSHWMPGGSKTLWNRQLAPIKRLALRGAIWYQGETDASSAHNHDPRWYGRDLLKPMVAAWREHFGVTAEEFPFYFVQLAGYLNNSTASDASGDKDTAYRIAREGMFWARRNIENCGMAVVWDCGRRKLSGETDVICQHPRCKNVVGSRLALLALKNVYGDNVVAESPYWTETVTDGQGNIRVKFDLNGSAGLTTASKNWDDAAFPTNTPGAALKGFAIAGGDKKWYWADAVIESPDTIRLSSSDVPAPLFVRYCYRCNPVGGIANGYNAEMLPIAPIVTAYPWYDDVRKTSVPGPEPDPDTLTTNAMANAAWGYEIRGLGVASNEVALVFTNTAATMTYALPGDAQVVRYLVAAGGGAGGASSGYNYFASGGGGAGGLIERNDCAAAVRQVIVTVGAGGASVSAYGENVKTNGNNGADSSLTLDAEAAIVAVGGGGGGGTSTGNAGGSGGGAGVSWGSSSSMTAGGKGTSGQGFAGGGSVRAGAAAGGGGAGCAGDAANDASKIGGTGGAGRQSAITGAVRWYCAGGGGGAYDTGGAGAGGTGGGGAGCKVAKDKNTAAGNGKTWGCGGGGTAGMPKDDYTHTHTSGAGYQGVVIVRYRAGNEPVPPPHVHEWGEWTTNAAPTCIEAGSRTRTCTVDGCTEPPAVETNVLAALDHDWSAWVTDVEPQIGVPGHKYRDCTRCDAREEETLAPLQPVPTEVTTNAMANGWGYEIRGLGAAMDEVALVFTNTAEEAMDYPLPDGATVLRYLVAAGGGAGGASSGNDYYQSGGGGAGGLLTASDLDMGQVAKLTVSVGAGGAAVSVSGASAYKNGTNGGDSSLTLGTAEPIVAHGGGGGAGRGESTGNAGGSGGGAGVSYSTSAAAGSTILTAGVEGYAGGKSYKGQVGAGGGGGAGGAGGGYTDATKAQAGCAGGRGVTNDIAGAWAWFCAGGGGGSNGKNKTNIAGGAGGKGGGGAGGASGSKNTAWNAGSGTNYGCGGGGTSGNDDTSTHASGAGYQGVVIVRYRAGATPTGKWDAVEASQVDGVTDANKVAVETTLDAIQASLPEGAAEKEVANWLTTVYGNRKVAAATLANAKQVGISVKYDLPLLVSVTPTVTVEAASGLVSEKGVAAFVFTIKDGDTPVSVAQAKVQEMVQYAATLAGGFAPSTSAEVEVTPDGTSFKAELKRVDGRNSGFMKVELK